jgi:hypothetical protein
LRSNRIRQKLRALLLLNFLKDGHIMPLYTQRIGKRIAIFGAAAILSACGASNNSDDVATEFAEEVAWQARAMERCTASLAGTAGTAEQHQQLCDCATDRIVREVPPDERDNLSRDQEFIVVSECARQVR